MSAVLVEIDTMTSAWISGFCAANNFGAADEKAIRSEVAARLAASPHGGTYLSNPQRKTMIMDSMAEHRRPVQARQPSTRPLAPSEVTAPLPEPAAPKDAAEAEATIVFDQASDLKDQLPAGQRAAMKLFLMGITPSEIADLSGREVQDVKATLTLALALMRELLEGPSS